CGQRHVVIFGISALALDIRCHACGDPVPVPVLLRILVQPSDTPLITYLTTSTGQWAWETIPLDTLPSSIFLNPPSPLVPTMIRSTFSLTAWLIIVSTTEETASGISALTAMPCFSALDFVSPTTLSATFLA